MPGGAYEQSVAFYLLQHQALTPLYGNINPKVWSLNDMARALWPLGYSEQALTRKHEAPHLTQELSHPYSLAHIHGDLQEVQALLQGLI